MYRVTAWEVESDVFNGIVYTQQVLLSKLQEAREYTVKMVFFYRYSQPMPHMTYTKVGA